MINEPFFMIDWNNRNAQWMLYYCPDRDDQEKRTIASCKTKRELIAVMVKLIPETTIQKKGRKKND